MDANLRRQTLADTLRRTAARVPDRLGLACGATRWTYREFHAVSERLAAALLARGIRRGDKVAVLARNSHGFVALRYALMRLGAVMVPINFMLQPDDVAFILNHSGARMLACDSGMVEIACKGAKLAPHVSEYCGCRPRRKARRSTA
jgi:fatty-acyl-CoA synthase